MTDAVWQLPITELARRIAARQLSSAELVGAYLARIERLDGDLASFVSLSPAALDAARAADAEIARRGPRGPLHGIPVGIKDNYTTADLPTRAGTAVEALAFPREDSHCVAKLRDAFRVAVQSPEFKSACDLIDAPIMYLDGPAYEQYVGTMMQKEKVLIERLKLKELIARG